MDQHIQLGVAELCQTHRVTRLYSARSPLSCGGCGALIDTNELFTRPKKGTDGADPPPLCRRCRPFTPRPDLAVGRDNWFITPDGMVLPGRLTWSQLFVLAVGGVVYVFLSLHDWPTPLAALGSLLVSVAVAVALVLAPRLIGRGRP
jgi:hypothetical protein